MPGMVVVGTQWGDEGKGKVVDLLSERADMVVRYQGGHNAGHTVVRDDQTFVLHLVPSGILHPGKICVIGSGVVVDPSALLQELDGLSACGIDHRGRLMISPGAHLIMPYHKVIEKESEKLKGARRIGTTGRGIGPAYVDKMARIGIRVGDLFHPDAFREKLSTNLSEINYLLENLYKVERLDSRRIYEDYLGFADRIREMVTDCSRLVNEALDRDRRVLFEGAQGTHLDIDHGTYPFVTSSSASAGGACIGSGVGPTRISRVVGVVKAYTTRVGGGPFPSELKDDVGHLLQEKGNEFGATTGRARRCGWFDAVLVRYAVRINGISGIALTKLDVLDHMDEIKIAVAYRLKGTETTDMPSSAALLDQAEPVYETHPGWRVKTTGITRADELPERARQYVSKLEKLVGTRIFLISTGSHRSETIPLEDPFETT